MTKKDGGSKMVCERWCVTKLCVKMMFDKVVCVKDGVSKAVGDKVVCETWCAKDGG